MCVFADLGAFSGRTRGAVSVREGQGVVLMCAPPPHSPGWYSLSALFPSLYTVEKSIIKVTSMHFVCCFLMLAAYGKQSYIQESYEMDITSHIDLSSMPVVDLFCCIS